MFKTCGGKMTKANDKEETFESEFNKFIMKWCGSNSAHLLDTDENDGERIRQLHDKSLLNTISLDLHNKIVNELRSEIEELVSANQRLQNNHIFDIAKHQKRYEELWIKTQELQAEVERLKEVKLIWLENGVIIYYLCSY